MINLFAAILCLMIFNSLQIFGFFNAGTYRLKNDMMVVPEIIKLSDTAPESRKILTAFRIWCENNIGQFWSMPIIACPICMASVHSALPYFGAYAAGFFPANLSTPMLFALYPFYICALSAFNKLVKPALAYEE